MHIYRSKVDVFSNNNFGSAVINQFEKILSFNHIPIIICRILCSFLLLGILPILLSFTLPILITHSIQFRIIKQLCFMGLFTTAIAEAHSSFLMLIGIDELYKKMDDLLDDVPFSLTIAYNTIKKTVYKPHFIGPFIILSILCSFMLSEFKEISIILKILCCITLFMFYTVYLYNIAIPKIEKIIKNTFYEVIVNKYMLYNKLIDCNAIVARNNENYIGIDNKLMYKLPKDMKNFKKLTSCNGNGIVIMGRKTFESMGCKPLKNRINIVVSSKKFKFKKYSDTKLYIVDSVERALAYAYTINFFSMHLICDNVWIIGGSRIYDSFMKYTRSIYSTLICDDKVGDTKINISEDEFLIAYVDNGCEDGGYTTYKQLFVRYEK